MRQWGPSFSGPRKVLVRMSCEVRGLLYYPSLFLACISAYSYPLQRLAGMHSHIYSTPSRTHAHTDTHTLTHTLTGQLQRGRVGSQWPALRWALGR